MSANKRHTRNPATSVANNAFVETRFLSTSDSGQESVRVYAGPAYVPTVLLAVGPCG